MATLGRRAQNEQLKHLHHLQSFAALASEQKYEHFLISESPASALEQAMLLRYYSDEVTLAPLRRCRFAGVAPVSRCRFRVSSS